MKIVWVLKSLTFCVGLLAMFSVLPLVGFYFLFLFWIIFMTSILFELKGVFPFPRFLLNLLSISSILLFFFRFSLEAVLDRLIESLLILLGIKFLENKSFRDYMEIYTISVFLLAASAAILPGIRVLFLSVSLFFLLNSCCVLLSFVSKGGDISLEWQKVKRLLASSLSIPAIALPLAAGIFIILPRTQYPILGFIERPQKVKTGFTDTVRLGASETIYEDEATVFRVQMERVNEQDLYFRGIVLDQFDGISWRSSERKSRRPPALKGKTVAQVIILEPQDHPYLFALDKPIQLDLKHARATSDLYFVSTSLSDKRTTYRAISVLTDTLPALEKDLDRLCYVAPTVSKDVRNLALRLTMGKNEEEKVKSVVDYLKRHHLHTLSSLPVSKDPLQSFLFVRRQGNCEFFASACAVMLRISGIPSRLVGGFKGGYYNEFGRYYLVTGRHAHVWVEAYLKHKGWVRIDPTPSSPPPIGLFTRVRIAMDTINYYFYTSIIGYSLEKQLQMLDALRNLEFRRPAPSHMWRRPLGCLLTLLLLFALLVLNARRRSREQILLDLFLRRMRQMGYVKSPSEGLTEFVSKVREDQLREKAKCFTSAFQAFYYTDRLLKRKDYERLKRLIKSMQKC